MNAKAQSMAGHIVQSGFRLFTLLLWVSSAPAQSVPMLINYQGRLANADGSPLSTSDYVLRISIYDAPLNGNLVWGPQVFDNTLGNGHGPMLPVVQGHFNALLGPVDTQGRSIGDAFTASNRYIEMGVGDRPAIAPRQQIVAAPFALQTGNSATWDGLPGRRQVGPVVGLGGVAMSKSGRQTTTSTTFVEVNNLVVTLPCSGRPVEVALVADSTDRLSEPEVNVSIKGPSPGVSMDVLLLRNGSPLGTPFYIGAAATFISIAPGGIRTLDTPRAGSTNIYSVQFRVHPSLNSSFEAEIGRVVLVAYEL